MSNAYLKVLEDAHKVVETYLSSGNTPNEKAKLLASKCSVASGATATPKTIDIALETIVTNIPRFLC